jgi:hypothetical protein
MHIVVLIVALALVQPSARAHAPELVRLKPPDARLNEEFTNLTSLRELSDGRVIVTDRKDGRLALVNFTTGAVRSLGHRGSGPVEYGDLGPVVKLTADSSIVIDIGNSRWLVLVGDSVTATVPPENPAVKGVIFWVPFGADRFGNLLSWRFRPRARASTKTDSVELTRVSRSKGRVEVIGALRYGVPTRGINSPTIGSEGEIRVRRAPYNASEEQPLLFEDGWIAIARYEPYRVDWISPGGQVVRGASLPGRPIPMSAGERQAYIARKPAYASAREWPVHVPPFDKSFPLLATPEGWVVIPRVPSADYPTARYDFVARTGALRGQLTLPGASRLLAFGKRSAYVVVTDSDGIERLQRHPWP